MSNHPNLADEDIYVNITIENDTQSIKFGEFAETQTQPLLLKQNDYKMSVVRFDMPSSNFPIFVYQNNMSVTLFHPNTGAVSEQLLIAVNRSLTPSTLPIEGIWYIDQLMEMINTALSTAFTALGALPGGSPTVAPYFAYEPETKLISLYTPFEYQDTNAQRIEVWTNFTLFDNIFPSFDVQFTDWAPQPDGKQIRFLIKNLKTNIIIDPTILPEPAVPVFPGQYLIKTTQGVETTGTMFTFYKIVITSNIMNIRHESLSTSTSDGNPNNIPIVTDFDYSFDTINYDRITYIPTAEYRWIDLLTDLPLTQLGFKVHVQDQAGKLTPVRMLPGDSINIKFLFRKK